MSIICSSDLGWVVDHEAAINQACSSDRDAGIGCAASFRCLPDLFAIHHQFMMDTQFEKLKKLSKLAEDSAGQGNDGTNVQTPPSHPPSKKRKRKLPLNEGEEKILELHHKVKDVIDRAYSQLLSLAQSQNRLNRVHPLDDNNLVARAASAIVGPDESLAQLSAMATSSGQPTTFCLTDHPDEPVDLFNNVIVNSGELTVRRWLGASYLIPAKSSCLMSDISHIDMLLHSGWKYDVIVLDPPWLNKAVKRKRGYSTLSNVDLLQLPIPDLAAPDALIVVWVTNRIQHQEYITDVLFPAWHVDLIGRWYWLKVTTGGEMVYNLDSAHKKPYEALLIGRVRPATSDLETCRKSNDSGCGKTTHIPSPVERTSISHIPGSQQPSDESLSVSADRNCTDAHSRKTVTQLSAGDSEENPGEFHQVLEPVPSQRVIISVPCSIHSRKPPLNEILAGYLRRGSHCLELFARNLLPGWTSWGNEVLKFQHMDYFEKLN